MALTVRAHSVPHTRFHVRIPPMLKKYVKVFGSKKPSLAAMLAVKTSAVNLWNPLHTGEINPGFETQRRHHQKFKTGVSVDPQKGLMSFKLKRKSKRDALCDLSLHSVICL